MTLYRVSAEPLRKSDDEMRLRNSAGSRRESCGGF